MKNKINKKHLIWIITICLIFGIILGAIVGVFVTGVVNQHLMGDYDLYNCIYNNADLNEFNNNPIMIKKIQDECVCFRENNYANLLEAKC